MLSLPSRYILFVDVYLYERLKCVGRTCLMILQRHMFYYKLKCHPYRGLGPQFLKLKPTNLNVKNDLGFKNYKILEIIIIIIIQLSLHCSADTLEAPAARLYFCFLDNTNRAKSMQLLGAIKKFSVSRFYLKQRHKDCYYPVEQLHQRYMKLRV